MSTLDHALAIACKAHAGQTDIAGVPYILHPLRLMMQFEGRTEQVVAVLHDSVEDSDVTLEELAEAGFEPEIVEAIDALSCRPAEVYEDFIDRVVENPLAAKVKLVDIRDNMDTTRLHTLTSTDHDRLDRYHRALRKIESKTT